MEGRRKGKERGGREFFFEREILSNWLFIHWLNETGDFPKVSGLENVEYGSKEHVLSMTKCLSSGNWELSWIGYELYLKGRWIKRLALGLLEPQVWKPREADHPTLVRGVHIFLLSTNTGWNLSWVFPWPRARWHLLNIYHLCSCHHKS